VHKTKKKRDKRFFFCFTRVSPLKGF